MEDVNEFADKNMKPPNTAEIIVRYVDGAGKQRIKGGADLKASQAYPRLTLVPPKKLCSIAFGCFLFGLVES